MNLYTTKEYKVLRADLMRKKDFPLLEKVINIMLKCYLDGLHDGHEIIKKSL